EFRRVLFRSNGKGKSSAAMGVMLRGVARGWSVGVVQFLKSGKWNTGESKMADQLGVDWWMIGNGFTWDSEDLSEDEAVAQSAWEHSKKLIESGDHRLVILDEITYPMNWTWIDADDVVKTIQGRPEHVSIVCTGRNASAALIEIADTVTSMEPVKHAYKQGIRAMKGIDY